MRPTMARARELILVLKPASLICSDSSESSTSESRTHGASWWLRHHDLLEGLHVNSEH